MSYHQYWGKANKEQNPAYHLLPYHSLDVAAVAWHLLAPDKAMTQHLAKQLQVNADWLRTLLVFCLALHDLGKFARAFQGLQSELSPDLVKGKLSYAERHDSLGFALWQALQKRLTAANDFKALEPWLEIVTGHHGMPPKKNIRVQDFFKLEDEQAALEFIQECISFLLKDFDVQILHDRNLNKRLKTVSWQLAGVAVLADWLGSNQQYFPYHAEEMTLSTYWSMTLTQAASAVATLPELPAINQTQTAEQLFKFAQFTPLQQYALTEPLTQSPQLFILEDVTGAGKTEAALILTQRLMTEGLANGVYIALPTMATANAMYQRISKVYKQFYQADAQPSLVLAHGARELVQDFQASLILRQQSRTDSHYESQEWTATAYCNAWLADSRKKALLADVGVGTLDQALLAVLPVRHQSLRLLGLAGKVLLVDEVHAYDPYMQSLLERLLEAHARQGGSVILLSATLPHTMREKLIKAFHQGLMLDAPVLHNTNYPLVTHSPAIHHEQAIDTRDTVKRTVNVQRLDHTDNIIQQIKQAIAKDQCVCWLRNTVKSARQSYQDLLTAGLHAEQLTLFHSRFAMIDRQTIENSVLARFGDGSGYEQRKGQVLIATQVVEQSLDLDFDVMITDLAPIDLLIQRAGRLMRHQRDAKGNRIDSKDQRALPVLYLYAPEASEQIEARWLSADHKGTQAIYPHVGQLWLTVKHLMKTGQFTMPDDARTLIEAVYSGIEPYPDVLDNASIQAEGKHATQKSMADFNKLNLHKGYTRDSGTWDEETKYPTRLSEEDTRTVALAVLKDGQLSPYAHTEHYAWALSTIKIPEYQWEKVKALIPNALNTLIETLKTEQKALRWLEVFPLTEDTQRFYNAQDGWCYSSEQEPEH